MPNYYLVGGFVRDELLGRKSKDIDFAVEASSYEEMRDDLIAKNITIFQERPEYFSIRGRHPTLGGVDYTLCRSDDIYSDNRRPDSVSVGTIFNDLARRDFTMNAIAKMESGAYIDPHNGREDLRNGILRTVGYAEDRFGEDPLRLLRAMRFHIVYRFTLAEDILDSFHSYNLVHQLKGVSKERAYEELKKCFETNTINTLKFFRDYPILDKVIFLDMKMKLVPEIFYESIKKSPES